jgi:hypothetical protein
MRLSKEILLIIEKEFEKLTNEYGHEFVNKNTYDETDHIETTAKCKKCSMDLHFYYDLENEIFDSMIYEIDETYDFIDLKNFKCNDIIIENIIK